MSVLSSVPCSPLIRPFGPPSPRGEKGMRRGRESLFSPAGRRCRQADEGATGTSSQWASDLIAG
ncbi:hypothetical protein GFL88_15245 [Rhizobium leguminosarum bv. viciae]|nr:hypothetical protein [Rhizobium leguminosarum bv. viciae]